MKRETGLIVEREELVRVLAAHRRRGEKIVFTNGCFDLLHVGHVQSLAEAASYGDILVVGLNSDKSVRQLKGPARPILPEQQRALLLIALRFVDYVVVFPELTPAALIEQVRPDVLVKGGDYGGREIVGAELVCSYGRRLVITPLYPAPSTTSLATAVHEAS